MSDLEIEAYRAEAKRKRSTKPLPSRFSDDNIRYYSGPHLWDGLQKAKTAAAYLSPGADIVDANNSFREMREAWGHGNYGTAMGHAGWGLISSAGLSEIAKPAKAASILGDQYIQAIFAGMGARIADSKKLARAERLAESGADASTIWKKTGWFRGADGKWRFEIGDGPMRFKPKALEEISAPDFRQWRGFAGDLFEHPELFRAYPELATLDTIVRNRKGKEGREAYFVPRQPTWGPQIRVDRYGPQDMYDPIDPDELKKWLLHEFQHRTQWYERFTPGGGFESRDKVEEHLRSETDEFYDIAANLGRLGKSKAIAPEKKPSLRQALGIINGRISRNQAVLADLSGLTPYEVYRRLAGEVEARNVEKRMALMPWERRSTLPSFTQDFPPDMQYVLPPIDR